MPRLRSLVAVVVSCSLLLIPGTPTSSAPKAPSVRLVKGPSQTTMLRFGDEPVFVDLGTFVASDGGPFEIRVRIGPSGALDARQVVSSAEDHTRVREVRRIPASMIGLEEGLLGFFDIVARQNGRVVGRTMAPFCPGGWEMARMHDRGPRTARFPQYCWASPIAQAVVWGVDDGWAAPATSWSSGLDIPDGDYDITMRIAKRYVDLLAVPEGGRSVTVRATVKTYEWDGHEEPPVQLDVQGRREGGREISTTQRHTPEVRAGADGLPDLVSLPAWQIGIEHDDQAGTDAVVFGATIWNAGRGPLAVEGFRRPGRGVMDAFQYVYKAGRITGRYPAGTFQFDARDGHDHWHFADFAQYRLMTSAKREVVRSQKEAFCLAPTDAVDLTIAGANWTPGSTGLHSACGWRNSIWIREILDAGWGDTYFQWVAGQSFDITDVPNGTYLIEVTTNPDGRLREATRSNNTAYTEIALRGRPGARRVVVSDARIP